MTKRICFKCKINESISLNNSYCQQCRNKYDLNRFIMKRNMTSQECREVFNQRFITSKPVVTTPTTVVTTPTDSIIPNPQIAVELSNIEKYKQFIISKPYLKAHYEAMITECNQIICRLRG